MNLHVGPQAEGFALVEHVLIEPRWEVMNIYVPVGWMVVSGRLTSVGSALLGREETGLNWEESLAVLYSKAMKWKYSNKKQTNTDRVTTTQN